MPIINNARKNIINQSLIKEGNLKALFSLIYHRQPISRSELSELTDLRPTTVSSLVDELIQGGLVISVGTGDTKNIGRKPIMLEINPSGAYFAAFRWCRNGLQYYLYDLRCNIVEHQTIPIDGAENFARTIYETILNNTFRKIKKQKLLAVCISIPAMIDNTNYALFSSAVGLKDNKNIIPELIELFPSLPIIIGNESIFFTYAEKECGCAKNTKNLFYVNISDGVGAGIILDGKLYKGSTGFAGEFGHTTIDLNGVECECGNHGCLENYLSLPSIVKNYSSRAESKGLPPVKSIDEVATAYSNNDPVASETIREVAHVLAFGLYNVITLLNIDIVIIGGGIQKFGIQFLDEVRKHLQPRAGINKMFERCSIAFSTLDNSGACLGAVRYFIDNIMTISIDLENNLYIY
ncbi:MAG TPA: ROK family protein [Clostridiaceae bacterium]|nr:ROK family protein [Clostridiaceae bacterium]